jgi:hypothetical protein
MSTPVTETRMAAHEGRSASRKMGSASLAPALTSSSVTSSRWWFSMIGYTQCAAA